MPQFEMSAVRKGFNFEFLCLKWRAEDLNLIKSVDKIESWPKKER